MLVKRSYRLKIKPSKTQLYKLNNYFYEAKCLYNYALSTEDVFKFDTRVKDIFKLDKDGNKIAVKLSNLPAKLRQNVIYNLQDNIKKLSKAKKKGIKVGRLKYKSEIGCIDLDNQCFKLVGNKLKLAGMSKEAIKLRGLKQLGTALKTHNAWLIKEANGFYISICCSKEVKHINTNKVVGIDMGIKDNITLSNGEKHSCSIGESERTKKLQRKLCKSTKGSNNRRKLCLLLQKANARTTNKKKEFVNQLIHKLISEYDLVVWQDELLSKWKKSKLKGFGRKLQHSCLGLFKVKLQQHMLEEPERFIQLDSKYATTQLCPNCGSLNKHSLDKRVYTCSCGYTADRDIHSANNMLVFASKILDIKLPSERRDVKPVERKSSAKRLYTLATTSSAKQETQRL